MKKKNIFVLAAVLSFFASPLCSFDRKTFWREYGAGLKNGDNVINAGAGLSNRIFNFGESFYVIPPVSLGYEKMVHLNGMLPFSFGAMVSVSGNGARTNGKDTYRTFLEIPVAVKYHFNLGVKNLDVYAGNVAGLGFAFTEPGFFVYPVVGGFLGASWFFTENIGASVDLGYPYVLSANFSFKF